MQQVSLLANVEAWRSLLGKYDRQTSHHSQRVAYFSALLGKALGIEPGQQELLHGSAMLHDIGKLAVPTIILHKPDRLTTEESLLVKKHSEAGARLLEETQIAAPEVISGVLYHHERYDGSGYPIGLKGDDIPLFARVIGVADVFDALTSERAYRIPFTYEHAINYIEGNAGILFDPSIVGMLRRVYDESCQARSSIAQALRASNISGTSHHEHDLLSLVV